MKKRTLIILFVILTLLFAICATTVAYAEGETSADTQTAEFTKQDTIKLIIVYCLFGLSIVVGIPAIKAVNKRKRKGYVEDIVKETRNIAEKTKALCEGRGGKNSKKDELRYAIKIAAVADMALTTYTEKQEQGYFDIYNDLNTVKNRLSEVDKAKDDNVKYEQEFLAIVNLAEAIAYKAAVLAENEKIIGKYRK